MDRNTLVAVTKNRVAAIKPANGTAARAGLALIARGGGVVKVRAAGSLKDVAAVGRHVPQLRGRAGENRLGEQRVVLADKRVVRSGRVFREGSEAHTTRMGRRD